MNSKLIWIGYLIFIGVIGVFALNSGLSFLFGLGNPILYEDNPLYGYRPLPNQEVLRFNGKRIKINNLGLRCDQDWDTLKDNKVIFLGNSVTYGGSYIDNNELFSTLALKGNPEMVGASGGVNGWGVSNINALLIKNNFYPAKYYVSVLLENDFHRGLAKIGGSFFVTKKPNSAINEVLNHYLTSYMQSQMGHSTGDINKNSRLKYLVQEYAMKDLKQIDDTLKSKHYKHLIFISPSAAQVFRNDTIDGNLKYLARKYDLNFIYLLDELKNDTLIEKEIFHDTVHLEVKGHLLWANKIKKYLHPVFY